MKKLVLCTLLIALMVAFESVVNANTTTVTVSANPLWADTGIILSPGSVISITATGSWTDGVGTFFGPDGYAGCCLNDEFEHFDANDKGRLIAFIGPDPYQGHWGDGNFFPQPSGYISIGSARTFTATAYGKLWLGINDDATSKAVGDNSGSVTASIFVTAIVCDIQLNKTTFVNGDQIIAQVTRLANPGKNPVPVEVKLWFELPGSPLPVPFLTVGADGSFVLPPGFDHDFGPLPLATVQASYPRGQYQFGCQLLHAVTGAPLAEDFNPFQLQ